MQNVCKITTGKSCDELSQHDNKTRRWTRSGKTKNMYEWVTTRMPMTTCMLAWHSTIRTSMTSFMIEWLRTMRTLVIHLCTYTHRGSSLSLSYHLHGHPCVCGLFTLILPFYYLLYLPLLFLFLKYMKFMINLHNSCNEGVDASDDLLLSTVSGARRSSEPFSSLSLSWRKLVVQSVVVCQSCWNRKTCFRWVFDH